MIEVRWHGRAGQGAKSASQLLAMAALSAGRQVQAFPEYGPERGGAPIRAYTRIDERPIRRRYGVTEPDAVVVLEPSLLAEVDVTAGLPPGGRLLVNADARPDLEWAGEARAVDAAALAPARYANVVMLGALAAVLGEPPREALVAAVRRLFGRKLGEAALGELEAALDAGAGAVTEVAA